MVKKLADILRTALLLCISFAAAAQSRTPEPGKPLLELLRTGGFILFMRHTHADVGEDNYANREYWKDCREQRRISPRGTVEANLVGTYMRDLKIPVGRVVAGNLCRAQKSAELLRLGPVQTSENLNDFMTWTSMGRDRQELLAAYRKELSTPPEAGTNTVLVSHAQRGNYAVHPVLDLIEMGTIAVFRPLGPDRFELIATLRLGDWPFLGVSEIPSAAALR